MVLSQRACPVEGTPARRQGASALSNHWARNLNTRRAAGAMHGICRLTGRRVEYDRTMPGRAQGPAPLPDDAQAPGVVGRRGRSALKRAHG